MKFTLDSEDEETKRTAVRWFYIKEIAFILGLTAILCSLIWNW